MNAYISVGSEEALAIARQAEQEILSGFWKGPIHGIPIGLKDLIYTQGMKTTMGSEIYQHFIPDFDATVVKKLKKAGAIIVGKLNIHQFAYGPTGDISFYDAVRNPHDLSKIPGGSSNCSGAAVSSALL